MLTITLNTTNQTSFDLQKNEEKSKFTETVQRFGETILLESFPFDSRESLNDIKIEEFNLKDSKIAFNPFQTIFEILESNYKSDQVPDQLLQFLKISNENQTLIISSNEDSIQSYDLNHVSDKTPEGGNSKLTRSQSFIRCVHALNYIKAKAINQTQTLEFIQKKPPTNSKTIQAFKILLNLAKQELDQHPLTALDLLEKINQSKWAQLIINNPLSRQKASFVSLYQEAVNKIEEDIEASVTREILNMDVLEILNKGKGVESTSEKLKDDYPHYNKTITIFDTTSNAIRINILSKAHPAERARTIEIFINMAYQALKKGNFYLAYLISCALNDNAVERLHKKTTNHLISLKAKNRLKKISDEFDSAGNLSSTNVGLYAERMHAYSGSGFIVPILTPFARKVTLSTINLQSQIKDGLNPDKLQQEIEHLSNKNLFLSLASKGLLDKRVQQLEQIVTLDGQNEKLQDLLLLAKKILSYTTQQLQKEKESIEKTLAKRKNEWRIYSKRINELLDPLREIKEKLQYRNDYILMRVQNPQAFEAMIELQKKEILKIEIQIKELRQKNKGNLLSYLNDLPSNVINGKKLKKKLKTLIKKKEVAQKVKCMSDQKLEKELKLVTKIIDSKPQSEQSWYLNPYIKINWPCNPDFVDENNQVNLLTEKENMYLSNYILYERAEHLAKQVGMPLI